MQMVGPPPPGTLFADTQSVATTFCPPSPPRIKYKSPAVIVFFPVQKAMGSRKLYLGPPQKIRKYHKFLYNEGFIQDFETDVTILQLCPYFHHLTQKYR